MNTMTLLDREIAMWKDDTKLYKACLDAKARLIQRAERQKEDIENIYAAAPDYMKKILYLRLFLGMTWENISRVIYNTPIYENNIRQEYSRYMRNIKKVTTPKK